MAMIFGKSRTQQNFKKEADINYIVERARKAGGIQPAEHPGRYEDVSNIPDYTTAMNVVIRANNLFDSLPSKIRMRFDNNPEKMIEFLRDAGNVDEAIALGMLKKVEEKNEENEETKQKTVKKSVEKFQEKSQKGRSEKNEKNNEGHALDQDLPLD